MLRYTLGNLRRSLAKRLSLPTPSSAATRSLSILSSPSKRILSILSLPSTGSLSILSSTRLLSILSLPSKRSLSILSSPSKRLLSIFSLPSTRSLSILSLPSTRSLSILSPSSTLALSSTHISTLNISHECHAEIKQKAINVLKQHYNPYVQYNKIQTLLADSFLKLIPQLELMRNENVHVLILSNMPIDSNLPNTPNDDNTPSDKSQLSETILLGLGSALNCDAYNNADERNGQVIQNVIPIIGKENEFSSRGSKKELGFHTENSHEMNPLDYLIFCCLRDDPEAHTHILDVDDILSLLETNNKSLINVLKRNDYIFKSGPSYHQLMQKRGSILNEMYNIEYNSDINRVYGINEQSQIALTSLRNLIQTSPDIKNRVQSYNLKPGDYMIINNKKVLHGRGSFQISTTFDLRRWLQRVYLKKKKLH